MSDDDDDFGMHMASDVLGLASTHKNRSVDVVLVLRIRPGQKPAYETRVVKKRRSRRRKEVDGRQAELFA